ncbi:ABC transporter substrate-binding protein [Pseudooceanicola nanhaiensis]|jgi:ABC-type transport system substrate-binding protein|uniref:ABC transporter substrate-binding protein n=5 Tax=Pseudooceanicola nanhaiensis TaxID=375761 RepID=A0A917SZI4_9RHOB|nr:ABC transporter substrate-binding protein [Pseudooceanicola nanhaiensis]GGM04938.1 ABC transporter substrate-binding protein [Pseudooceanicola nanhaiensis]
MRKTRTQTINALPPLRRRQVLAGMAGVAAAGLLPRGAFAQDGNVLKIRGNANPSSLDPATGGAGSDHVYLYNFYDTLVDWEPETLAPKPGLAASWEFPEPKTLVLKLQEGVTFHDGSPFNAEAVKFNLDRARTAGVSNIKSDVANIAEVEATDELTVTLTLSAPDTALPLILSDRAGMMISPDALGNDPEATVEREPVGTGPWTFGSWTDGEKITGSRFEDHWREGVPGVDNVEFVIIPETATGLRAIQSGQVNIAYQLDERQQQLIDKMPNLTLVSGPTLYIYQLYVNSARGALQDVRVRRALSLAIDREAYVAATQAGVGEVATMNLPQAHWAWSEAASKHVYHDPEEARRLLEEAGYGDGLELDFRGYPDQASVQRQEVLMAQWKKIGVTGRFRNAPIAEVAGAFFGEEKAGDLLLSAWTGRPDPSLTYALLYSEESYYNPGRVTPPEGYMEALQASRESTDQADRAAALARVQDIAMEAHLSIPLSIRYEVDATGEAVTDFVANLLGKPKFRDVKLG